ncbi:MAG: L-serine ammonia-lyase, iron-sulfur-dependent, subunit alpha [Firmicutes bacterium]|nr:L-serine ammonia-lyase, iron-sulfur-dependent, subunit alpha [Bacillota bacterium]
MESIKDIYKIGRGPSSSHTMAPNRAAFIFIEKHPAAQNCKIILYGSLAKTGKGHLTDKTLKQAFLPRSVEVVFDKETVLLHPMVMDIIADEGEIKKGKKTTKRSEKESKTTDRKQESGGVTYNPQGLADDEKECGGAVGNSHTPTDSEKKIFWRVYSLGGGRLKIDGDADLDRVYVYPHRKFDHIKSYCAVNDLRLYEYVESFEGWEIFDYLREVWAAMKQSIDQGLATDGILDGGLGVKRKAKWLYNQRHMDESAETRENRLVCAFAYAVSEQNASGGQIVTAPTCGACGVLPAVLRYMQIRRGYPDEDIIKALATAGIIGEVIKTNASISGAECGCQAEIGSACAMAAAALGELFAMSLDQIEYAAEICIEHHLGLTCDPIAGLVQVPCIERNAVAAMRAINAVSLANFLTGTRLISFDTVVETMFETGKDLGAGYRETGESGLAKLYKDYKKED